jgi:threonine/homoserine/homoserine lactone efflux protein
MEPHTILLFAAACVLLAVVPGPDMAFIVTRSVAQGRRAGVMAVFGISFGSVIHLAAVLLGLSAILLASTTAFNVVKMLGAAYLIYIGVNALFSRKAAVSLGTSELPSSSLRNVFWQGFISDVLNPKVAIFYIAFLPQFVDVGLGHQTIQLIVLGAIENVITTLINLTFVIAAATLTKKLRHDENVALLLQRAMGLFFVALGARLASQSA